MTTPTTQGAVSVRAAAKINLHLGVGAPREDGFHPLVTVYQAIGLYDDLEISADDDWSVEVVVADYIDRAAIPAPGTNIVDAAAALLARQHDREVTGRVRVAKSIPVAGGLAGGSADAAAALLGLDRLWGLHMAADDLRRLAADLGSDVPFALLGGTAIGTGRGERVRRVVDPGGWWWVVVPSAEGLSTPAVYRHFDAMFPHASPTPAPAEALLDALASGDAARLAVALHNDLERPALDLRPDLRTVLDEGLHAGALRGIVSGSGPTCVFLCESEAHARSVAGSLVDLGRVALVASGAVPGARVLEVG